MTQPQPDLPPLFNAANRMLAKVPAALVIGKVQVPQGEQGVVTIYTPCGEQSYLLDKAEAADWADNLAQLRDSLSGSNLVIPGRGDAMRIADSARNGQPR